MRKSPVDVETLVLRQLFLQYRQDILVRFASMNSDLAPTDVLVSGLDIGSETRYTYRFIRPRLDC